MSSRDILKLVKEVLNPNSYTSSYIDDLKNECQDIAKLVLDSNGDVYLNYNNSQVCQNIYDEMQKYKDLNERG